MNIYIDVDDLGSRVCFLVLTDVLYSKTRTQHQKDIGVIYNEVGRSAPLQTGKSIYIIAYIQSIEGSNNRDVRFSREFRELGDCVGQPYSASR